MSGNQQIYMAYLGTFGDLGRLLMKIHHKITIMKYWVDFFKMEGNYILKREYSMLRNDINNNNSYNNRK